MSRMNLQRHRLVFSDSPVVLLHVIASLFLFQSHRVSSSDVSLVTSPSQMIVAFTGDNITLPCHLKPETDASALRLEWARPDLSPGFVHVWANSREHVLDKQPSYRGRTSLSTNKLQLGDISLKLFNVMLSDEGTYRCLVPQLGLKAFVKLVVCVVSTPVILVMSERSSAVELQCQSVGWYPEPELLWLDGEGNLLSGATETFRGPDNLYTVSSRVTVEKKHSSKVTCRVQQNNINQSRETWIHVQDDFVTDPPPPSSDSSSLAAIIGLIVGILFIVAVAFFLWKWRQIKLGKKKHHGDEETVTVREKTNTSGGNDALTASLIRREAAENVDMERNPLSERTGSDIQIEDETHQSQTNNHLIQTQQEMENQPGHERAEVQPSVDRGRRTDQPLETMSGLDKDQEDTTTSKTRPAEIDVNNEGDETGAGRENTDRVKDEERQEQLKEVRNTENNLQAEGEKNLQEVQPDLDKETEKLTSKLQLKERQEREYEKQVTRLMGNKTERENKIKDVKEELEEVERKLHLKNKKEETQTETEDEKDLQRKKEELQECLKKLETALERTNKEVDVMAQKKMKATKEKEEIIRQIEMKNRNENQSESDEDL